MKRLSIVLPVSLLLAPASVAQTVPASPQIVLPGAARPAAAEGSLPPTVVLPGAHAPAEPTPAAPAPQPSAPAAPTLPASEAEAKGRASAAEEEAAKPEVGTADTPPVLATPTEAAPIAPALPLIVPLMAAADVADGVQIGAGMSGTNLLRLTGEHASSHMLLRIPDAMTPPEALTLTLRSSVNVDPELSSLSLRINDGAEISLPIGSLDFAAQTIPTTDLRPGLNTLTLTAVQPHRIFCGPDASFGVWSEVNLAASGLQLDASQLPVTPAGFLAALQASVAGGEPVRVLADPNLPPEVLRHVAATITDLLAVAGTEFRVSDFYTHEDAPYPRIAIIASEKAGVSTRLGADGGLVLQVETKGIDLPDLASAFPPAIERIERAPQLLPGTEVSLSDLAVPRIVADTHYFRQDVPFRLPDDWLIMANQRSKLTLHYGFASDLPKGALLLVKANGTTVRLLPLDVEGGQLQPPLDILFRANLLRPGLNVLTFEAMIPGDPPDAACQLRRSDMLVVMEDTSLTVPDSPRMRLAGLGPALAGLSSERVGLPQDLQDRAKLDVDILPFTSLIRPIDPRNSDSRLTIVSADHANLVPINIPGVSLRDLQSLLLPKAPVLEKAPALPSPRLTEEEGRFAPPVKEVPGPLSAMMDQLRSLFSSTAWTSRKVDDVEDAVDFSTPKAFADWIVGQSGEAILFSPDPQAPNELWLITAPGAHMGQIAVALEKFRHSGLARGDAALLQPDGSWLVWSANTAPELLEPLRLGNIRAVLGNYASWSPMLFTAVTMALAFISVVPALLFIRLTRRKGKST